MKKKMALNDEKSVSRRESTPPSSVKYSTKWLPFNGKQEPPEQSKNG